MDPILTASSTHPNPQEAAAELAAVLLAQGLPSLVVIYASPEHDRAQLASALSEAFPGTPLIGCTTAGEIGPDGLLTGGLSGVALARQHFEVATVLLEEVRAFGQKACREAIGSLRGRLTDKGESFAYLLVDGLSVREEGIVAGLYHALGATPLFGGSAGDGLEFGSTWILHDGRFHKDAAVVALVHTELPFHVFKSQHFQATGERMVVTEANPATRIVTEINGGPAAEEYARAVGLELEQLDPQVFSMHPVVVRVGGSEFVRSIQQVNPDGSLTFFCAIETGVVLTVSTGVGLVENLESALGAAREVVGDLAGVIGCDCILRRLEIEAKGLEDAVNELVRENRIVGFSTYGEQYNAMHVNQTFTGVAIGLGGSDS